MSTTLASWLAGHCSALAVPFDIAALGACEVYRLESPDGAVVSRQRIGESEFWLSDESPEHGNTSPRTLGGSTVRLILTVADPDALYARAVTVGATPVSPVGEEHGWRSDRLGDPFGLEWEIGRPLPVSAGRHPA